MRNRIISILTLIFIFCLLLLSLGGCGYLSPGPTGEQQEELPKDKDGKSQEAPAFTLSQLESGEEMDFPLDFQGQKVMLLFFFGMTRLCGRSAAVAAINQEWSQEDNFQMVLVSSDAAEDMQAFMEKNPLETVSVLMDPGVKRQNLPGPVPAH